MRDGENVAHLFPNQFFAETDRLIIGTCDSRTELILDLVEPLAEKFVLGYEVRIERGISPLGTYRSDPLTFGDLKSVAAEFRKLFEQDARHHTFVFPQETVAMVVYDEHDLVFAYGDLADYRKRLLEKGFEESYFELPFPHIHSYLDEMDEVESRLLNSRKWTFTAMEGSHDSSIVWTG